MQNASTSTGFGKHTDINVFVFLCVVSTFFGSWKKYIKLHNTVDMSEISKEIWNKVTVNKWIILPNKAALNELSP